ncbi:MAG: hypothetical protein VYA86_01320 [Candidatus Thermoplasmatota archaeon]|nr:hypothetical protein [Candidatus Thermoplasmatota archaeon]
MRQQGFCSIVLAILILAPFLFAAPEALRTRAHEGVIHTSDQTWSGNFSLDDDVVIASGATLVIQSGTQINVTEDITITIQGSLQIQGTPEAPVEIWGSWIADTSIQARWQGFLLDTGSISTVSHAIISDSRGGFDVEIGATLTIDSTHFSDSIIGVWGKGSVVGTGFECLSATTSCLRVDGTANLSTISSTSSAGVIHVHNGAIATIASIDSNHDSEVLTLEAGSIYSGEIHANDFTRMIRASGTVSATVTPVVTGSGEILVDATSLSGLAIENGQSINQNATVSSTLIGTVIDLEITSSEYNWDGAMNCIDAQINGELRWSDVTITQQPSTDSMSSVFARLRGSGGVVMDSINLSANPSMFDISGGGGLNITNSQFAGQSAGTISGWDLDINDSVIVGQSDGLVLLDVESNIVDSQFSRTYSNSDTTSTGLLAVWSEISMQSSTLVGWNDGIRCESECIITGTTVTTGGGGRTSGSGITIDGGSAIIQNLQTSASDIGIDIVQGQILVEDWSVDMAHRTYGIQLSNDAHATIRNMPTYTSSGLHDGFGDGTLLWGSTGTPDIAVSVDYSFTESTISITDLVGQPIAGVSVSTLGFEEITDVSGQVSLPLLSSGSLVEAQDPESGMGSSAILYPPGGDIQIAIVPGTGDWTIPAGVNARLSSGEFMLEGNLTIESTASLTLVDSTLTIPTDALLSIQPNGVLNGDNGTLEGGIASLTAGAPLQGVGGGLTLNTAVTFTCYDPWIWTLTSITGPLHLNQDCELILHGGHASGTITVDTDASLTQRSLLSVTVLDAGEPVQGANVSVGGAVQSTDVNGQAHTLLTWRIVDEDGDANTGTQRTVVIQHANINRYKSWVPTTNADMAVMISTIKVDSTSESLRLESIFSPWHLGDDLLVSSGTTLEIMPDAELSLAPDAGISIEGVMLVEDAWIGGTASAGLSVGANGVLHMSSTLYSGGSISVGSSGTASLASMTISDAPLIVSPSGVLEIIEGTISQTDICIRATGTLNMHGTTIENCGMYALWTTDAYLWIEDITVGAGNSNGAWIQQSSGTLSGWDTENYDGDGAALFLQMVDGTLSVNDMALSTGSGDSALRIEQADDFEISDSTVTGSPGVLIEESEMRLNRVDLIGSGIGVGISVLGTPSAGTIIDDCDVDGYETALRLEGGIEETEGIGVTILNSHLHANRSIDSNTLPFTVQGGELDGSIHLLGLDKDWSATIIGHDDVQPHITGDVTLYIAHTWEVSTPQGTTLSMTIPEFDFTLGEQQLEWIDPTQITLIHQAHTDSGMTDAWYAQWSAISDGYLPSNGQLQLDTVGQRLLNIEMIVNEPPVVTITAPNPMEINAGQSLNYSATATDPNGDEIIEWIWVFENADYTMLVGNTASGTTTDTEQGEWYMRATAVDAHGAEGTATVAITVNAADADNDYIESCPSTGPNAWWDALNNRFCGPDVFDVDDDNDNFRDEADFFPFDPCAYHDTDEDGLPNSVANNCETDLVVDDDDDGDGVLDSEDLDPLDPSVGAYASEDDSTLFATLCSPPIVLSLSLMILFSTFAYLRYNTDMRRDE